MLFCTLPNQQSQKFQIRHSTKRGTSVGWVSFCHLRLVLWGWPNSALSTALSHKEEAGYVLQRPRRSVICSGTTMSTAWGWGGRLWYYMGHTGSESLLNQLKILATTPLLRFSPSPCSQRKIVPTSKTKFCFYISFQTRLDNTWRLPWLESLLLVAF